ncbi:MAG: glutamine synthetase type III, partial [Flavobacteriales bacterium]|nr:glutamine synthetase type III [Flavobacteriales bacterium]
AIFQVLKKYIIESKNIRFEGNGYGGEWVKEAKKRGLSNVLTTPEAMDSALSEKSRELFGRNEILSSRELEARYEIDLQNYVKKIQIESRVMGDLAINHIVPIAVEYQNLLVKNVTGLKQLFSETDFKELASEQLITIRKMSERMSRIQLLAKKMRDARKRANQLDDTRKKAGEYCNIVIPFFDQIRREVDKLELVVSDEYWPLPKYRELLFNR